MTVDDLIAAYIEARNAVEWGAEKPITGVTDYHRGKTTDAAPAVCVWKLADPDVVESGCGQPYSAEVMRDICPSCGKPIAFKDANHG